MKINIISIRLNEYEKNIIKENAKKLKMSISDYIRHKCAKNRE